MVKTKISDIDGSRKIALGGLGEIRKPALGNGTDGKPGDLVGIDATGKIQQAGTGGEDYFTGILDDLPTIAEDTVIPINTPCSVIVPQSGHEYKVKMLDQGAGKAAGLAVVHGTDGAVTTDAAIESATLGYLSKAVVDDDTVCQIQWK